MFCRTVTELLSGAANAGLRAAHNPTLRGVCLSPSTLLRSHVIQVKRVYNLSMTVFRYGREHYEEGEYVRHKEAVPGDSLDPVVRIVEDLGTIEIPCGKVDCRANCLEYLVRSSRRSEDYALAECKLSPLVSII
jgi:hypothetical protein